MQTETLTATESQIQALKTPAPSRAAWSFPALLGFRFAFVYLVLYSFPGPLAFISGVNSLFDWYYKAWRPGVTWTATHIFHRALPYNPNGSDTLQQNLQCLLMVVIAVAAMTVWSVLDRKRGEYRSLHQWLRLYVRLTLGAALLIYGADKVIKVQFPNPFLWRLLQPYGDSEPMGLLWTFMGYSRSYNIFTGLVEMAGGALLMAPRLATLGALVSLGAMANVFMLNVSYGVTVKLYSLHLLLMSGFLLLPELSRLGRIFILNRPAQPVMAPPLFRRRALSLSVLLVQLLFLVYCAGSDLWQAQQRFTQFGDDAPKPPLYGIYAVDEFVVDGKPRPPAFNDETRWRRFVFDRFSLVGIEQAEGSIQRYQQTLDLKAKTLQLRKSGDPNWKAAFTIEPDAPSLGLIKLSGDMDGKQIRATLRKLDLTFPLYNRGFHWISEFPYNR
ncbi:MAG TPA: hypothetical protein VF532_20110 [Candidatus Angelobacter sp.]